MQALFPNPVSMVGGRIYCVIAILVFYVLLRCSVFLLVISIMLFQKMFYEINNENQMNAHTKIRNTWSGTSV